MKRHVITAVFSLVVFGIPALVRADEKDRRFINERTVTVQGQGKLEAAPDIARLSVGISDDGSDADKTAAEVRDTTKQLLRVIKAEGIVEKDIQTEFYSLQPKFDYAHNAPRRVGYTVSTSVGVAIRDLTKVGRVLAAVAQTGATNITGPNLDFENPSAMEKKALALAAADAKAKADILAQANGASLGSVLVIQQDGAVNWPGPRPMFARSRFAIAADAAPQEQPIATGEQSFTSSVTETFALK